MTAQAELEKLTAELHRDYEQWYDRSVRRSYRWYLFFQVTALLAGFGATLLAAIWGTNDAIGRILVVTLPSVGALASSILLQFRIHDCWRLREDGRVAFQDLALEARMLLASATQDAEYTSALEKLRKRILEIESDQKDRFFALTKRDLVPRPTHNPPPEKRDPITPATAGDTSKS